MPRQGFPSHTEYLVAFETNVTAALDAEQSPGLRVTAPDGDSRVRAMRCLILIQFARSIWILAWNEESGPGDLSRRLAALRYWPSWRERRGIL